MSKKSVNFEADKLRQLIQDANDTAGEADRLEAELSTTRTALDHAADLSEGDSLAARVVALEAELSRARTRADTAAAILNRDGHALEQSALRKATEAVIEKHGAKATGLDQAIIQKATDLLNLFAERRELEARCHTEILADAPQRPGALGLGHLHALGIPQRANHIVRYTQALFGVDEAFS